MKPIHIWIPLQLNDAYIYHGNIFAVTNNGEIISIALSKIVNHAIKQIADSETILTFAITRNDWYSTDISKIIFRSRTFFPHFIKSWKRISNHGKIIIEIGDSDLEYMQTTPDANILDMKMYGMKLFLAGREGLHESAVKFDEKSNLPELGNFERVFDSKTISLSAKNGAVMLSTAVDGLFAANFQGHSAKIKITESAIRQKSLRSNWSQLNLFNYEGKNEPVYLKNKSEKLAEKEPRQFFYSKQDEENSRKKITKFATSIHALEDDYKKMGINKSEIVYFTNTNNKIYIDLINGETRIYEATYSTDKFKIVEKGDSDWLRKTKIGQTPLSNFYTQDSKISEYFDKVVLVQKDKVINLTDQPSYCVRSFLASRRYKNIILIVDESGLHLFSLFPKI